MIVAAHDLDPSFSIDMLCKHFHAIEHVPPIMAVQSKVLFADGKAQGARVSGGLMVDQEREKRPEAKEVQDAYTEVNGSVDTNIPRKPIPTGSKGKNPFNDKPGPFKPVVDTLLCLTALQDMEYHAANSNAYKSR